MPRALSFVRSAVEFNEYRTHLKSVSCPHCHAVGHLNRHGYLKGYEEEGSEEEIRGWRIFCSNRGRRRGCGRTHSVLRAECLPRRTVRAGRLWQLLQGLKEGWDFRAVWKRVARDFSLQCGVRLLDSLQREGSRIRSLLCRISRPPVSQQIRWFLQTIEHLQGVFPDAPCPVTAFHLHFQQPFLA